MKKIWKFQIQLVDFFSIENMPEGAEILTVQCQHGVPHIWALCDPNQAPKIRYFRLVRTGHEIAESSMPQYLGSFQLANGRLVFHLFEIPSLQ